MKIIEISPKFTYTCQFCKKEFENNEELIIILKISPVCSYRCEFNIIYRLLKEYSKTDLVTMKDYFKIQATESNLIFELTKKVLKLLNPLSPRSPNNHFGQSGHILNEFDKPNKETNFVCLSK